MALRRRRPWPRCPHVLTRPGGRVYGRGEAVCSTAPDYASYRADADTSTLTVARLAPAALRVLERFRPRE